MSNSTMLIFGAIDAIVCCTFPSTLKKSGLLWSSSLEPNSTQDFADLVDKFLTHFSTNSDHKKTSANLINLHQRSDETFKDFMQRFNQEAIQIHNINLVVSLHAILAGFP